MAIKKKQQDFFFKVRTLGKHKKNSNYYFVPIRTEVLGFSKKPQNSTEKKQIYLQKY